MVYACIVIKSKAKQSIMQNSNHSLYEEEPDLLPPVFGFSLGPMCICCVQCRLACLNICFFGLDPSRPLEDFPEYIQPKIYRYAHIGSNEVTGIEFLCFTGECVKAAEQNNDGEKAE